MWLCQNESAAFWMNVLTTLKSRGVEDILVTSTDNLKGFVDAIKSVYPQAKTQICIVHQLRNSLKFVVWKDKEPLQLHYARYTMPPMSSLLSISSNSLMSSGVKKSLHSKIIEGQLGGSFYIF